MKHSLSLEYIGYNYDKQLSLRTNSLGPLSPALVRAIIGKVPSRLYVAEIKGRDPRFFFKRFFLKGRKDFIDANSVCSRGVKVYFTLDEGKVYEIKEPISWKRNEVYYLKWEAGVRKKTYSKEEACEWLASNC